MLDSRNQGRVFLKLQEGQTLAGVQIIENLYKEFEQNYPFEYSFMDDSFDRQYKLESLTGKLANMFSLMAIAISCLGLFGLTSFLIDRKTREIGIRKVLGASVSGLIIKLSSGFMKLFVLAVIFGSSIAYFLMINYLKKFAYHMDFNFWIIGVTAGVLFLISQLTVIYHISKAVLSNPAEILRNE
jgi:ABC-type antimicrobial peptide transport system permease subunit